MTDPLYIHYTAATITMQVNRVKEDPSVQTIALYTLLKYVEEAIKLDSFVKVFVHTYIAI